MPAAWTPVAGALLGDWASSGAALGVVEVGVELGLWLARGVDVDVDVDVEVEVEVDGSALALALAVMACCG
jgi:hypothetical protein